MQRIISGETRAYFGASGRESIDGPEVLRFGYTLARYRRRAKWPAT